jgi:hypothetical protein
MNRFVINIFFNRNFFVNKDGGKTSSHMRRVINDVGWKFLKFTGKTPLIYQHYDGC